jgi:hypothetical protein
MSTEKWDHKNDTSRDNGPSGKGNMITRFLLKDMKTAHSMRNVYKAAFFGLAAITMLAAAAAAQAIENPVAVGETSVAFTECSAYDCNTSTITPSEAVQKITASQRSAIMNKDCKALRSEFGKNLEDFPFEFRDTGIIGCVDDRPARLWITENNYHRFLANKDAVTTVAEYHDYLKTVGYSSRKLVRP